jgi:hypothetical protein
MFEEVIEDNLLAAFAAVAAADDADYSEQDYLEQFVLFLKGILQSSSENRKGFPPVCFIIRFIIIC